MVNREIERRHIEEIVKKADIRSGPNDILESLELIY